MAQVVERSSRDPKGPGSIPCPSTLSGQQLLYTYYMNTRHLPYSRCFINLFHIIICLLKTTWQKDGKWSRMNLQYCCGFRKRADCRFLNKGLLSEVKIINEWYTHYANAAQLTVRFELVIHQKSVATLS